MGDLQNAVSALLDAFARGISVIKAQRGRRKTERLPIESTHKTAETRLSKSLKRNRADVRHAYGKDLARLGPGFASGDVEAQSSLSAILFRLNAGFVSVIERFTRGQSTPTDYNTLVKLSNASRVEAIHTFEQLSKRLSQSSLPLVPANKHAENHSRTGRKRRTKKDSSVEHPRHARSKSAPQLSLTPLGPATPEGWVRPKPGRKLSSESSGSLTAKRCVAPKQAPSTVLPPPRPVQRRTTPPQLANASPVRVSASTAQCTTALPPTQRVVPAHSRSYNRKSIMSFASDSTKLGEIPEHKWTTPGMFENGIISFPVKPYYPLEPYQAPEKPRSRFMRLFKRS